MKSLSRRNVMIIFLFLVQDLSAKEIDSKTDLQQEESINGASGRRYAALSKISNTNDELQTAPSGQDENWPLIRPDIPQIKNLNVKCEKNHMKVNVEFDRPFYGMIFSKGHYSDSKCVHLPAGTGHLVANFEIFLGACGMNSNEQAGYGANAGVTGLFIENTIIIQYDSQVQEIWDQARRLRCTWYDFYEKAVSFRPFNVDMLDAVTANFLGDNIQCWMQIQAGKGPWASEVAGIVKIGQTMTMVLAIKDDENKFDMLVRNCMAHDGKHQPVQLVDEYGCVVRPNVMSKFHKVKNFGNTATAVSYAYFQAFKFPDSMNVHFQCVIQVCRYECPEPVCDGGASASTINKEYLPAPRDASDLNNKNAVKVQLKSSSSPTFPTNILMNRKGDNFSGQVGKNYSISHTGGTPRSLKISRRKRDIDYKDINTQKMIQVVAPGDVAFAFSTEENDNSSLTNIYSERVNLTNSVCMSTVGFIIGLVILILILIITCLVSIFFFIRIRAIDRLNKKMIGSNPCESIITYENPEFFQIQPSSFHIYGDRSTC